MIPCKQLKCLKFPICKAKTNIKCDALRNYHEQRWEELGEHYEVWKPLNEAFPNIVSIQYERWGDNV